MISLEIAVNFFTGKIDSLVETMMKRMEGSCVYARERASPTTYSKNHIPFHLLFYNYWDGQYGRQLKQKYVSYV